MNTNGRTKTRSTSQPARNVPQSADTVMPQLFRTVERLEQQPSRLLTKMAKAQAANLSSLDGRKV